MEKVELEYWKRIGNIHADVTLLMEKRRVKYDETSY